MFKKLKYHIERCIAYREMKRVVSYMNNSFVANPEEDEHDFYNAKMIIMECDYRLTGNERFLRQSRSCFRRMHRLDNVTK